MMGNARDNLERLRVGAITVDSLGAVAAATIIGNNSGGSAAPSALTTAQVLALLSAFTGDSGSGGAKGLVPAPAAGDAAANKFLKANGQWVAGVAAGTVLLATQTASGASSIDFTSGLTSAYDAYLVAGTVTVSSAAQLRLRTSTNGGSSYDSGASDYGYGLSVLSTVPGTATLGGAADHIKLTTISGIGNASTDSGSFSLVLYKPSATAPYTSMHWQSYCNIVGTGYHAVGGGHRNAAADVDALRFYPDAGTVSGTIRLYGLSKT